MKTYFTRLFNYDRYANNLISAAITNANGPGKPVQLMSHLLVAQQIWVNRCKGIPAVSGALWPTWKASGFEKVIKENHNHWVTWLDGLTEADFERSISYQNLKGEPLENRLTDILAHVINHGTHHRGQIGQQLKFAGFEQLPVTDYIYYIRELNA